jgi:hypothetical protein
MLYNVCFKCCTRKDVRWCVMWYLYRSMISFVYNTICYMNIGGNTCKVAKMYLEDMYTNVE